MDWKIFEEAGKYAGLAGLALIALLFIIRQILNLKIFDRIGGRGTQLTINNIINKIFWVTIAALAAWLFIGLFGKNSGLSGELSGPVATFGAQSIQVSDLPSGITDPVSDDSPSEETKQLQQRSSLALNGTTLVVGAPGEGRTVTIGCNTLRMTNGARIITNGNRLVILCLKTLFGDNSGIMSFPPGMPKAGTGAAGLGGGSVRIAASGEMLLTCRQEYASAGVPDRRPLFWVSHPTGSFNLMSSSPSDSGVAFADIWQGKANSTETYNNSQLLVDENVSTLGNPSGVRLV